MKTLAILFLLSFSVFSNTCKVDFNECEDQEAVIFNEDNQFTECTSFSEIFTLAKQLKETKICEMRAGKCNLIVCPNPYKSYGGSYATKSYVQIAYEGKAVGDCNDMSRIIDSQGTYNNVTGKYESFRDLSFQTGICKWEEECSYQVGYNCKIGEGKIRMGKDFITGCQSLSQSLTTLKSLRDKGFCK